MLNDRAVGFAGSALIALGGLGAGALPAGVPFFAGDSNARIGLVAVYSGLALLTLGWWRLGRGWRSVRGWRGRDHPDGSWRTLALWSAPLLFAPPMFSRDVYSYLAQGLMIDAGLDVHRQGPAELGGPIAAQVPEIWQHTPSPYGPLFLMIAERIAAPLGSHVILGVLLMRLVAVAGLMLIAYAVRVLARQARVSEAGAVWLAVLNPLTLIHVVGGAHNDAIMVGLLAAGLASAVRGRPLVATLLVTAAALVKAPAALGLGAVALIWTGQLGGRWRQVRAGATMLLTTGLATVVITAAAGTGYGWLTTLGTPITAQNWSLTSLLGRWTASALAGDGVGAPVAHQIWRAAGILVTLVVAALVVVHRDRLGVVHGLGIVLVALVVFGPAIRPWYLLWGLAPLAATTGNPRVRRLLAACCVALALVTLPDGFAADPQRLLLAVLGALIGVTAFLSVRLAAPAFARPAGVSP